MTIYKYAIPLTDIRDEPHAIRMPAGAALLNAQPQHGAIAVWALVDPNAEPCERRFRVVETGQPIDGEPGAYLGTVQFHEGRLVLHVFEVAGAATCRYCGGELDDSTYPNCSECHNKEIESLERSA